MIHLKCQISKGCTHYTFGQHQKPTKNPTRPVLSNFLAKKEHSNGFPCRSDLKIWRAGNTTNLILQLEICRNFQLIHRWWTTSYFRRRKNNNNCDHKSSLTIFEYTVAPHLRAALGKGTQLTFRGFFIT